VNGLFNGAGHRGGQGPVGAEWPCSKVSAPGDN
jgi:hypothetical protein